MGKTLVPMFLSTFGNMTHPTGGFFRAENRPNFDWFPAEFGQNHGTFCNKKFFICFGLEIGRKSAYFWPIFGRICGLVQSLKILTRKNSYFICIKQKIGAFYTLEKPEKSPKPDVKKPGPARGPKKSGPACPKPDNCRPGTSLMRI